jgi:hypothetical protein
MKVIPETRREHDNGVMTNANKKQHIFKNMFFKWRFDSSKSNILRFVGATQPKGIRRVDNIVL